MTSTRLRTHYTIALLSICFFYLSYRYPFKINSSLTSPTYSDTPAFLAYGKYILLTMLLLYVGFRILVYNQILYIQRPVYAYIYCYLSLFSMITGCISKQTVLVEQGMLFLFPLVFHLIRDSNLNIITLTAFMKWTILIYIFVDAIQVFVFLAFGRLPALGYPNSMSVRFGSILDDPNSFGVLIALFFGFIQFYTKGICRGIALSLLMLLLILTQSLTAIVGIGCAYFIYLMLFVWRSSYRFLRFSGLVVILLFFGTTVAFVIFETIQKMIQVFLIEKMGSILAHLDAVDQFKQLTLFQLIGLSPVGWLGETGYLNLLGNLGVIYVLIYVLLFFICFKKLYNRIRVSCDIREKALCGGAFFFLITVFFSLFNLPFEQIFPINLVTYVIMGLITSHRNSLTVNTNT